MKTNWLQAFGLMTTDGELLAGTEIRAIRNHTRMVPIAPADLREHLYMLYIEGDDEKELLTVARCLRTLLGIEVRASRDRAGRPYLWRAPPTVDRKQRAST